MKHFFVGFHNLGRAWRTLDCVFVSVHRLANISWKTRRLHIDRWVMDSGAFTVIMKHGCYPEPVEAYAATIRQFSADRGLMAAVSQDYMCEPDALARTGLTVADHQRLTIERYDALMACDVGGVTIMPVLQGYEPRQYVDHIRSYGPRLAENAWVGVGSVCKRQGDPDAILAVLEAIHAERPDLRLHGFGVKLTAFRIARIVELLWSADSMAWSFAARKRRGDPNSPYVAQAFEREVLEAANLEPGEKLAQKIRMGLVERYADEDSAAVAKRRKKNEQRVIDAQTRRAA